MVELGSLIVAVGGATGRTLPVACRRANVGRVPWDNEVDVAAGTSPSSPLPSAVDTANADDDAANELLVEVTTLLGVTTTSLLLSACQINGAEALSVAELNHMAGLPTLLNCESINCAELAAVVE